MRELEIAYFSGGIPYTVDINSDMSLSLFGILCAIFLFLHHFPLSPPKSYSDTSRGVVSTFPHDFYLNKRNNRISSVIFGIF